MKGKHLGGSEDEGWQYDMCDAKLLDQIYFDTSNVKGTAFEAEITFIIKGKAVDISNDDLKEILMQTEPFVYNESLIGISVENTGFRLKL